jgi:hypothetical protein
VDKSIFADVQITAAGPALPVIGAATSKVLMEAVVKRRSVERCFQTFDPFVASSLLVTQGLKSAETIMDETNSA